MRGRWGTAVVGIGLVGCLIGGCSGPPEAGSGVRPSTTGASSPSPTVSAPTTTTPRGAPTTTPTTIVLPPAATAHTEDGAKAFARYYSVQMDEALVRADSSVLRALSAPSCSGCRVGIDMADHLRARGQHNTATTFSIAGTRLSELTTDTQFVVDVLVDDAGGETIDAAGKPVRKSAPAKFTLRQTVQWHDAGWLVAQSALL